MKKKIFACFMAMMLIMSLFTACGGSGGSAEGTTEISGLEYLDREYEKIEETLFKIGASIKRME